MPAAIIDYVVACFPNRSRSGSPLWSPVNICAGWWMLRRAGPVKQEGRQTNGRQRLVSIHNRTLTEQNSYSLHACQEWKEDKELWRIERARLGHLTQGQYKNIDSALCADWRYRTLLHSGRVFVFWPVNKRATRVFFCLEANSDLHILCKITVTTPWK